VFSSVYKRYFKRVVVVVVVVIISSSSSITVYFCCCPNTEAFPSSFPSSTI